MGKRIIRKRNKPAGGDSIQPDPSDFGSPIEDTGSGELQPVAGDSSEHLADEVSNGFIDPDAGADSGDGTGDDAGTDSGTGKRRGRRKGSRNKSAQKTQTTVTTRILFSIHAMGATFLKQPMLQITEQEAEALSLAILRVQEQYEMFTLTEKQEAWIQLGIAAASVYGPRVVAMIAMEKMKKEMHLRQQQENFANAQNVTQMPDLESVKRAQANGQGN